MISKSDTVKNDVRHISEEDLSVLRHQLFFDYHHRWFYHRHCRRRFITLSRCIGSSFYFAFEGFADAVLSGNNQVFITSKGMEAVFKTYVQYFADKYFNTRLIGERRITLSNGASLYFFSSDANTFAGLSGNVYVDQPFYMTDFGFVNMMATCIAAKKQYRLTFFGSMSLEKQGFIQWWNGEVFNRKRHAKNLPAVPFDLSHSALCKGHVGDDDVWRNVVNVEDAIKAGNTMMDIDELKGEMSKKEFDLLFMCQLPNEDNDGDQ